ncbi:MAG: hypothetical protein ACPGLW_06535 [Luminiphilus sp.]|nr:hypothetical protein [Gammaproteobacteria bacterium]
MRVVISLTFGILLAYVAGSVLGTQVVLNNVASMGLEVTLAMRWSSSLSDVSGLAGTLLPLMAIALLPGWLTLDWLGRRPTTPVASAWYILTGAMGVAVLHPTLDWVFGVDVFAPARTMPGLLGQALAGGLGGVAVALSRRGGVGG